MRAVVHAREVVPLERVVALDLDARGLQLVEQRLVHLLAADPVDEDLDLDARARALGERVDELAPDLAGPVDVGLEVDRPLRLPDGVEHRREDLGAVLEVGDAIAGQDRRAEERAELALELRMADGMAMLELALDALLAADEVERKDGDERREQRAGEGREPHSFSGARQGRLRCSSPAAGFPPRPEADHRRAGFLPLARALPLRSASSISRFSASVSGAASRASSSVSC